MPMGRCGPVTLGTRCGSTGAVCGLLAAAPMHVTDTSAMWIHNVRPAAGLPGGCLQRPQTVGSQTASLMSTGQIFGLRDAGSSAELTRPAPPGGAFRSRCGPAFGKAVDCHVADLSRSSRGLSRIVITFKPRSDSADHTSRYSGGVSSPMSSRGRVPVVNNPRSPTSRRYSTTAPAMSAAHRPVLPGSVSTSTRCVRRSRRRR